MPDQRSASVNSLREKVSAKSETPAAERRREARHATRFDATLELPDGDQFSVLLTDVSLHGCALQAESDFLHQGSVVAIGVGAEPRISAVVRWVHGNAAGMEFLRQAPTDRASWRALMDS